MKIILKKEIDKTVKKDWEYLEKKNSLIIFQTLKWNENWLKFNKGKNSIFIFIVYKDNKPLSIFPFYLQKKFNFKILKWIGFDISDYLGPIFDRVVELNEKEISIIWNKILYDLKLECDLIYLDKQIDNKNIINNPLISYFNFKTYKQNFRIELSKWELIKKNKNKSFQQFRRKKKNLSLLGKFKILINIHDIDLKKKLISQMIEWKKISKKKYVFASSFNKNFYWNIVDNQNIHVSAITLNGKFIAAILGLKYLNNYFFLVPSFKDETKYFKFSPGRILLIELINELCNQQINYFDFCDGDQNYKTQLANNKIDLRFFLKSNSLKGLFLKFYIENFKL